MNAADIKKRLFKPATIFETGGFRPTEELGESWIGAVMWGKPGEVTPPNYDPLFTLFLKDLEHVPEAIREFELITVYMEVDTIDNMESENLAPGFKIQAYTGFDGLQKINVRSTLNKSFPLKPLIIVNDVPPIVDDAAFTAEIQEAISELEEQADFDYEEDIAESDAMVHNHKVGGYPSFIQNGISFGDGYEFAFQISSDDDAEFIIGDDGNLYFFYNRETDDWAVACDYY